MRPEEPTDAEVVRILRDLAFAETLEAVWSTFCAAASRFGFDRINYAYAPRLVDPRRPSRSGRFTLSSHPDRAVLAAYRGTALDRSPMRRWAAENHGAISWSEQPRLLRLYGMEAEGPALRALLDGLGLHAGWTIGFPPGSRADKGAMGLTARAGTTQAEADAMWARRGPALEALAGAAHGRMARMPLPIGPEALTPLQREVLGWIADGKTTRDAATLTSLSVSRVEKVLREARAVLGVETTAQAVARVALCNQLSVPGRDAPARAAHSAA